MNLSLYKPNSKNSGCAFNFSIGPGTKGVPSIYCSAIQQYSWDSSTKTANFAKNREDPEKNINIKFNELKLEQLYPHLTTDMNTARIIHSMRIQPQ